MSVEETNIVLQYEIYFFYQHELICLKLPSFHNENTLEDILNLDWRAKVKEIKRN